MNKQRKVQFLKELKRSPYWVILLLWSSFTIFTFIWLGYSSLKTNQELFAGVWNLPKSLQWGNYVKAWVTAHMGNYFLNSVIVVFFSVILVLIIASPASYVLSRIKFKGNIFLLYFFLAGMSVPLQLLLVPLFILMQTIYLINTLGGLIIVYTSISLPFTVFLLTGFFRTLPSELEDAAALDGCSEFGTFFHVMLPLASPGIFTAAIFNFIFIWSEYLLALVLITGDTQRTLPLGIYNLRTSMVYTADWASLFAGIVIVVIPSFLTYIFLSEQMISGLTLGGVKG